MILLWLGAMSMMTGLSMLSYKMGREQSARDMMDATKPLETARQIMGGKL